jgi:ribosome-binding factor A
MVENPLTSEFMPPASDFHSPSVILFLSFIPYLCRMESTRQQKISRLIQKDLGAIFQEQSRNHFRGALITVTKVSVTKDLSLAKIYLSLFATKDKTMLLEMIRKNTREVRHDLGIRERNQLRVIPELQFFLDDSLDYIDNIDHLLHDNP